MVSDFGKKGGFVTLIFTITVLFIEAGAVTGVRIFAYPEAIDWSHLTHAWFGTKRCHVLYLL